METDGELGFGEGGGKGQRVDGRPVGKDSERETGGGCHAQGSGDEVCSKVSGETRGLGPDGAMAGLGRLGHWMAPAPTIPGEEGQEQH